MLLFELACIVLLIYALLSLVAYVTACCGGVANPNKIEHHNITLLIAHPDDECMFFGPCMRLLAGHNRIHVLCMTTGNYYGQGKQRCKELSLSCQRLLSTHHQVEIVDDELQLADHPHQQWNMPACSDHIERFVRTHDIHMLNTTYNITKQKQNFLQNNPS